MPKADMHLTPDALERAALAKLESLLTALDGGIHTLRHLAGSSGEVDPEALVFVADGLQRVVDELDTALEGMCGDRRCAPPCDGGPHAG